MGSVVTLRHLLESGESPDTVDDPPHTVDDDDIPELLRTPLHYVCRNVDYPPRDHAACLILLRDAGADLEATDFLGYRPLHCAVRSGNVGLLSLLVQSGVNVDAALPGGSTPLHLAVRKRAIDCIEVLLAAGASLTLRENHGRTPFGLALLRNYRRMWPLFLRAGAEIPINETRPYIVRVRNAGGFQRYAQQHHARITSILSPTPLLPPELVRHVVSFWLHAGYY